MNGLGQYQIRAQPESFGHAGLPFHHRHRQ